MWWDMPCGSVRFAEFSDSREDNFIRDCQASAWWRQCDRLWISACFRARSEHAKHVLNVKNPCTPGIIEKIQLQFTSTELVWENYTIPCKNIILASQVFYVIGFTFVPYNVTAQGPKHLPWSEGVTWARVKTDTPTSHSDRAMLDDRS